MALTQSAWTDTTVDGLFVSVCTVASTTAENDAYTLKTSTGLDPTIPWELYYTASATPDAQALPFDLYVGFSSSFAIAGDGATVAATDGVKFKQIFDDVVTGVDPVSINFLMDPDAQKADVVTIAAVASHPKIHVPIAPYYAFNLNGGSTLAAVTHTFRIVQNQA